ncbi:MAG TPA: hypothetical protein VI542_24495 [Candidatus Tectomicrobia bacterium]
MISKGNIKRFIKPYRITDGKSFRLKNIDPADTGKLGSGDKEEARSLLRDGVELLSELQEELYAQDLWGILLIFQAMDAAWISPIPRLTQRNVRSYGPYASC